VADSDQASGRAGITLEGWQTDPQLRWSFQHISEIFPTAPIPAAVAPWEFALQPAPLSDVPVVDPLTQESTTIGDVMARTDTDGWIVTQHGRIIDEDYPGGMTPDTRHLLMSVSKSIIGVVAGRLCDDGLLDPDSLVTDYVPDLAVSGYAGATVRHLLDMRSGIQFSENYLDQDAEVRVLEQAIGWAPRRTPGVPDSLFEYLTTLKQKAPHGGAFEYRSCETDVLGWVCERAADRRMAPLISELVWQPIGAQHDADIGVDSAGNGMFDGGISATLRDLVRFGSVFGTDGTAFSGARVLSPSWIDDTLRGADDSGEVFAASSDAAWLPGGMYRNQMWFPSARRDLLLCLGIHGQMIYVNRSADVVAAKLSSWPTPQDGGRLLATIAAFDAAAAALPPE
jgi:CubicO group peptidase (beta-lactamase class C family)